jgi:regulator of sirC expression with transglutaminase-like and TPR domain
MWGLLGICIGWSRAAPVDEIRSLLEQPEEQVDIGQAVLILSKDAFPDVDIGQGTRLFDGMARAVQKIVASSQDTTPLPVKRIGTVNTFLFRQGPWNQTGPDRHTVFQYDEASVDTVNPKALFVPHTIYECKGTCSTLPTLWYVIADRLGWPVSIVRGPGHLFVKYRGEVFGNIEATANGGFIPDSQHTNDMRIGSEALRLGTYMRPLSRKEFVSTLLVNNAYYSATVATDSSTARAYLQLAVAHDSTNAEALRGLGLLTHDPAMLARARSLGLTDHRYTSAFHDRRRKNTAKNGGSE